MSKPDFAKMTRSDLKKYIIAHRTDDEAIQELFFHRRNPNATRYPAPLDPESIRITEEAIRDKVTDTNVTDD